MSTTEAEWKALAAYRERLFAEIRKALDRSSHHKSYEGALEVLMPGFFGGDEWTLELHCYVLGPWRHYEWHGPTLGQCVAEANADLDSWTEEDP